MAAQFPSPFRVDCLQGRVALVTGGGSGIGFEITRQLLRHGCQGAVICGRRAAFLQEAAEILRRELPVGAGRIEYQVCDVRKPDECVRAIEFVQQKFGRMDILVNGAAGNFLAASKDLSPNGFATVMAIDALGTFNMCRSAHDLLSKRADHADTAVIINISANLHYGATWWQAHASAAKSAVDSLTRSLALEWGSDRIRVVGIAPGPIADTPGTTKLAPGIDQQNVDDLASIGIPLRRMGRAVEIGHAAIYLCTAQYVTGDVLVVDGGQWLYKPPIIEKEVVANISRQVEARSRQQAPRSRM